MINNIFDPIPADFGTPIPFSQAASQPDCIAPDSLLVFDDPSQVSAYDLHRLYGKVFSPDTCRLLADEIKNGRLDGLHSPQGIAYRRRHKVASLREVMTLSDKYDVGKKPKPMILLRPSDLESLDELQAELAELFPSYVEDHAARMAAYMLIEHQAAAIVKVDRTPELIYQAFGWPYVTFRAAVRTPDGYAPFNIRVDGHWEY